MYSNRKLKPIRKQKLKEDKGYMKGHKQKYSIWKKNFPADKE